MIINQAIISDIKAIISQSKDVTIRAIDHQRTLMYWHIGKRIFKEEQEGKDRADYGTFLIKYLSDQLQPEFGSGFSVRQINLYRQFYRTFPIVHTVYAQLSWSQVLAVARQEKLPSDAKEIIKDPMFLEFLGLKREASYYERDLETAIISHLQEFLLELGNGFSFVARQRRINLDGDDFFVDLVLYNRLLQCFVIIEIKTTKLTHQDIGQLQMYVNYFDRIEKLSHENATIGILLCTDKNDTVVKFTLPEEQKQIIASQYSLYLPTEKQLLEVVKKELQSFKEKK
ncbi:PDDEXK nuclease domain-containing protein [Sphingobacterium spiritivorum]|uniref:PDDEXK nuclease domain-containing protein n=1 Tax=Sphingobacterium spiritivorum TaxID=258 RepID=UPI003DA4181D